MSRKGNCWDNAPQESFFGHFKDEAHIKQCKNLDELRREVKRYMMYHNTARYQWKGQLAYLSTILDGSTNEILSYHVSDRVKMPLVTETIEKLFRNK